MAAEEQKLDFNAFVLSLGSSAIIHLGEAPDPVSGEKSKPDLALAQQSIDLLALLQDKTRGNLTEDESKFLEQLLYDLRMLFLQVSRAQPSAGAAGAPPPAARK